MATSAVALATPQNHRGTDPLDHVAVTSPTAHASRPARSIHVSTRSSSRKRCGRVTKGSSSTEASAMSCSGQWVLATEPSPRAPP